MPQSVALSYSRPDLVYLPVTDAAPRETCLVLPQDCQEPRVLDFVTVAAAALGQSVTSIRCVPMTDSSRSASSDGEPGVAV